MRARDKEERRPRDDKEGERRRHDKGEIATPSPFLTALLSSLLLFSSLAVAELLAATTRAATTPPPTFRARPPRTPTAKKPARPPLDFSGVWALDEQASSGFAPAMKGAILSVKQTGDRILIEPVGKKREKILAEVIVADGRPYEKWLGTDRKGSVTVAWGKDNTSLWIEVLGGPPENPRASVQRSVWKLAENGKVWVRQSVTIQGGQTFEARLVFRKRPK